MPSTMVVPSIISIKPAWKPPTKDTISAPTVLMVQLVDGCRTARTLPSAGHGLEPLAAYVQCHSRISGGSSKLSSAYCTAFSIAA